MSEGAPPLLDISGLTLAVGDRTLVRDLRLGVAPGEIVALVAPSGTGKTTLLRAIVRLGDPASGAITLGGTSVAEIPGPALRRRIRLVAQHPAPLGRSVADDLAAGAPAGAPPSAAQVRELLAEVGISSEFAAREPAGLSGGEQARVAIARALAGDPQVLLLDEPSAALDEATSAVLAAGLRARAARGLAILMATHDPALVAATGARVVELPVAASGAGGDE